MAAEAGAEIVQSVKAEGTTPADIDARSCASSEAESVISKALDEGGSDTSVNNDNSRRSSLMRFLRSAKPVTARSARSSKMPDSIRQEVLRNPGAQQKWFNMWLQCKEDWGQVLVYQQERQIERERDHGKERWLTAAQIENHFNSKQVAADLVNVLKTKPDHWRKHPQMPNMEAATQYRVQIEDDKDTDRVKD